VLFVVVHIPPGGVMKLGWGGPYKDSPRQNSMPETLAQV
jgi:hypothetical protein